MGKRRHPPPKVSAAETFDIYCQEPDRDPETFQTMSDKLGELVVESVLLPEAQAHAVEIIAAGNKPSFLPVRYRAAGVREQEARLQAKLYLAELEKRADMVFPYLMRHPLIEEPIWWSFSVARFSNGEELEPNLDVCVDILDGSIWSDRDVGIWVGLHPKPRYRLSR